jgi:hypothetical protein
VLLTAKSILRARVVVCVPEKGQSAANVDHLSFSHERFLFYDWKRHVVGSWSQNGFSNTDIWRIRLRRNQHILLLVKYLYIIPRTLAQVLSINPRWLMISLDSDCPQDRGMTTTKHDF